MATQALFLLNNEFVLRQANAAADQSDKEAVRTRGKLTQLAELYTQRTGENPPPEVKGETE